MQRSLCPSRNTCRSCRTPLLVAILTHHRSECPSPHERTILLAHGREAQARNVSGIAARRRQEGRAHDVQQGEGGEQGDPLMPSLFALGQHQALVEARARLHPSNTLYAFLDDIYVTGPPEHTAGQFAIVREALARHANIQVHLGKTHAWNSAGEEPPGLLEELSPEDPEHPCWTGNWAIPAAQQGVVVLGSPIGSREFIATKLAQRLEEQDRLLSRIPLVPNLQSAWLLLLYCAAPRSTYLLRTLSPADTADFAAYSHDAAIQHCLAQMLAGGDGDMPLPELSHRRAQLFLSMGGLGLGSAVQQRHAAYWSSWADTARALRQLQPGRAFWPPFSARCWTRRPGEPPPAREQQNRRPLPTLRRLPCANLGETAGGGCRRPRRPHHSPGPRRKTGLAANGIQSPAQARARDAFH